MTKVVFFVSEHVRSGRTANLIYRGLQPFLEPRDFRIVQEHHYREPCSQVAIFYGLTGSLKRVLDDYRAAGLTAILIDLGYWRRKDIVSDQDGYHRFSINDLHPWRYLMKWRLSGSRFAKLGVRIETHGSKNGHIVLAGMSEKAAGVYGLRPEQWEREAIKQMRRITRRRIIYRPKPSWAGAKPIEGVDYSHRFQPLEAILGRAYAVVTHHSNVAVDGIVAGIPAMCVDGAARAIACSDLDRIDEPYRPSYNEREQFIFNLAYAQWHTTEIATGDWWRFYKEQGMIP